MNTRPKRPQYFANKFCRLLAKSAAAMTIGADTCWMLTVIVNQEDKILYARPVDYWNDQLSALCGFGSRKRLVTARGKAVAAGWLHYEPGRKSTPGQYWVVVPDGMAIIDATKRNRKPVLTQRNGTENGTETEFGGNETEPHRGAMRNRKSAPFIPNPKPNPKERENAKKASPSRSSGKSKNKARPGSVEEVEEYAKTYEVEHGKRRATKIQAGEDAGKAWPVEPFDAEAFWAHYEANGWKQKGGNPIKVWRAAAQGWGRRTLGGSGATAEIDTARRL